MQRLVVNLKSGTDKKVPITGQDLAKLQQERSEFLAQKSENKRLRQPADLTVISQEKAIEALAIKVGLTVGDVEKV